MVQSLGKVPVHLLGDALDTRSAGDQLIERAASRTGLGHRFAAAAMVALQLAAEPVFDQPGRNNPDTRTGARRPCTGSAAHSRAG